MNSEQPKATYGSVPPLKGHIRTIRTDGRELVISRPHRAGPVVLSVYGAGEELCRLCLGGGARAVLHDTLTSLVDDARGGLVGTGEATDLRDDAYVPGQPWRRGKRATP